MIIVPEKWRASVGERLRRYVEIFSARNSAPYWNTGRGPSFERIAPVLCRMILLAFSANHFNERNPNLMQKQTVSFSRTLSCLALVGLLAFSTNNAVAQVELDGVPLAYTDYRWEDMGWVFASSRGNIGFANVYNEGFADMFIFENGYTIGTVNIHSEPLRWHDITLDNYGIIGTVNASGGRGSLRIVNDGAIYSRFSTTASFSTMIGD